MRLWSLVQWRAGRTPDGEMLVDQDGRRMTFAQFRDRAVRVSAGLAGHGVGAGTPVTWQLPTTIDALVLTAALARLGAVQTPVMPVYGRKDLEFVVRQTGAQLLVVAPEWRGRDLRAAAAEIDGPTLLDELPDGGTVPPADDTAGDPVRWIFYTSGTTAKPRGAKHTDATIQASSRCMGDRLRCTPADRVGLVFPVAHIGGCGTWLGTALRYGCTLILDAVFDAERSIDLQRREGVTIAGSGTVFTQTYLAAQRRQPDQPLFPTVRAFTSGAAPKPAGLHAAVKRELGGVGVLSGYGLTEAPILAMSAPDDPDEALSTAEGRVCDDVEIRVVDGELRVKGPQVMRGYLDPSVNAFDEDGYLRTGDLGSVDAHGNVRILGRLKDVIVRKGETISAQAVETELLAHPSVADVAVIGLPDERAGERVCAVVVPAAATSLADLRAYLENRGTARHQWPERLEIVRELPRNATVKVLKDDLRRRFG